MNYFGFLPSDSGSGSPYIAPLFQTTSSSSGAYQPAPTDFIDLFYAALSRWQSETFFVSDPDALAKHPSFKFMVANAELIMPLVIEELRTNPSPLVWVLDEAFSEKPYSQHDVGDIKAMTEAWITWAEKNYRVL